MTKSNIALTDLAEKGGGDVDVLQDILQCATQRLRELDVEGRCGAPYGERSLPRENSRNGYRERLGKQSLPMRVRKADAFFDWTAEAVRSEQPWALKTA